MTSHRRTLDVTDALVQAYSRRGNFHSDPQTAAALGMPGLVAQGAQVAGPAYGILVDEWGEEFLAHGELDIRFVGMVLAGESVEAIVDVDDEHGTATIEVVSTTADRTAVVGHAARTRAGANAEVG